MGVCAKKAICIRKRLAELKDELSQVIPGLGLGRIRPKQKSDLLARLRRICMENEISKDRLQARRIEAYNWCIVIDEVESPKELNSQKRMCRTKPLSYN